MFGAQAGSRRAASSSKNVTLLDVLFTSSDRSQNALSGIKNTFYVWCVVLFCPSSQYHECLICLSHLFQFQRTEYNGAKVSSELQKFMESFL